MARTANKDPLDKFRFLVTILSNSGGRSFVSSGGFTEVTLPKATVTEIKYRENVHGSSFIKKPGLVSYEPITLKKGVLGNTRDLYNWLKEVYDHSAALNQYQEALANFAVVPVQNPGFRRDIVISAVARDGSTPKHWYISNAFPLSYTAGDFNASENEKLIAEVTLTYEGFVEVLADNVDQAVRAVSAEALAATQEAVEQATIGGVTGVIGAFL